MKNATLRGKQRAYEFLAPWRLERWPHCSQRKEKPREILSTEDHQTNSTLLSSGLHFNSLLWLHPRFPSTRLSSFHSANKDFTDNHGVKAKQQCAFWRLTGNSRVVAQLNASPTVCCRNALGHAYNKQLHQENRTELRLRKRLFRDFPVTTTKNVKR